MRIAIIGGTGHIGTYLVPRLLQAGHEVICLSRGQRAPYHDRGIWKEVQLQTVDRVREDAAGTFGPRVAALKAETVIDLICFTAESARQIAEAIEGKAGLYLSCGTIWVHGPSVSVPTTETEPRRPFGDYGVNKAAMESWLLSRARMTGFPAVVLHPGHIVGRGWVPLNPRATSTRRFSRPSPGAGSSPCRTSGRRRSTTCTPTTWRRPSAGRWRTGPQLSARASTSCPRRP